MGDLALSKHITFKDLEICVGLRREVLDTQERIEILRALLEKSTSVIDDVGGGRGNKIQDMSGCIAALLDLEKSTERRMQAYLEHIGEVEGIVQKVGDPYQRIIFRMRYIDGEAWEDIASKMGYCERQCFRLHNQGLKSLGIKAPKSKRVTKSQ